MWELFIVGTGGGREAWYSRERGTPLARGASFYEESIFDLISLSPCADGGGGGGGGR